MDFVYFVILVGVLIFVHELGHFMWAKFFGVKVLKASLGFGPKLFSFHRGETEYCLGAIPLGGYVSMLGEGPTEALAAEDYGRAFRTQPLWKRTVIIVAGPAMNLILPIVLYFVVFLGDTMVPAPIVGTVYPHRPAYGQLEPGDRITSIDGRAVETFAQVQQIVAGSAGKSLRFVVDRNGEQLLRDITPALTRVSKPPFGVTKSLGRIGITHYHATAVVGVTSAASPAAAAGMRPFDHVIAAGGHPVERFVDLSRILDRNRGTLIPLTYLRPVRVSEALGNLVEIDVYEPHVASLTPQPGSAAGVERAGLEPAHLYVSHVVLGSPELRMGLLPGDRLVSLDGQPVVAWDTLKADLEAGGDDEHSITWRRGERVVTRRYRLRHERGVNDHGQRFDRYVMGMRNWVPMRVDAGVPNPHPISYAAREAMHRTWEMMELTVLSVVRLFQGNLTVKSIGGPLAILDVAGRAAREGTLNYLALMAFISVNLGLINLAPIPLLDGGHLMFHVIEAVSRRRLSIKVRQYASLGGLVVLLLLIFIAFVNDIERQWPQISHSLGFG